MATRNRHHSWNRLINLFLYISDLKEGPRLVQDRLILFERYLIDFYKLQQLTDKHDWEISLSNSLSWCLPSARAVCPMTSRVLLLSDNTGNSNSITSSLLEPGKQRDYHVIFGRDVCQSKCTICERTGVIDIWRLWLTLWLSSWVYVRKTVTVTLYTAVFKAFKTRIQHSFNANTMPEC